MFRRQRGFTIIQAMIGFALIGAAALGFSRLVTNMSRENRYQTAKSNSLGLMQEIRGVISSNNLCEATFGGIKLDTTRNTRISFTLPGGTALGDNVELRNYNLLIRNVILTKPSDAGTSADGKQMYQTNLIVRAATLAGADTSVAPEQRFKDMLGGTMLVEVNASGAINACYAASQEVDFELVCTELMNGEYNPNTRTCDYSKYICEDVFKGDLNNKGKCILPGQEGCGDKKPGDTKTEDCGKGREGERIMVCTGNVWALKKDTCEAVEETCGGKPDGSTRDLDCPDGEKGKRTQVCSNGKWVLQNNTCRAQTCPNGSPEGARREQDCEDGKLGSKTEQCKDGSWQTIKNTCRKGEDCKLGSFKVHHENVCRVKNGVMEHNMKCEDGCGFGAGVGSGSRKLHCFDGKISVDSTCKKPPKKEPKDPVNDSCFTGPTKVLMADGSYKPIETIMIGDKIQGRTMVNTVVYIEKPLLRDRYLYGFNGEIPFVTNQHPFWSRGGWRSISPEATLHENPRLTKVQPLRVGNEIWRQGTGWMKVEQISEVEADYDLTVYNLILDGDNTYYADGYLVHNKGGPDN